MVKHNDLKKHAGVEVQFHAFLTTVVGMDEWSDIHSNHFTIWERLLGKYYMRHFSRLENKYEQTKSYFVPMFGN